ncbi:MAG: class I tRNA ligase family protein, partial [Candidatus Woesearchaeota archaeon]|nr:class I tRNA ligase family protein [Candidatus Woesearchaeota archaeon]
MERYDPKIVEKKWQEHWEKEKTYQFDMSSDNDVYSIDTPPPTVSGRMHIGHAFSFSQQDFIARYKRMRGFNVFYPFGTDDNGLATEKLVQKKKNIVASRMDRNEFIKACLDFLKEERPLFIQDWKNVGMSCDFNMTYSSIDENCRRISQRTFLEMAKKKLVYRKEAP